MDSKIAIEAKEASLIAMRRLTAEERLNAFLEHCRLMRSLSDEGRRWRASRPDSRA